LPKNEKVKENVLCATVFTFFQVSAHSVYRSNAHEQKNKRIISKMSKQKAKNANNEMKNWADLVNKEMGSVKQWEVNWGPVFGEVKSFDAKIQELESAASEQAKIVDECKEKRSKIDLEAFTTR